MSSKLDNHITLADGGPIRVREKGFAVAAVSSLGRCAVENRGARVRVEGASGAADVTYECLKDSADAYAWETSVQVDVTGGLGVTDGISAPTAVVGKAWIYVDSGTGDLMVRFGDGVTKTLATDT